MDEDEEVSETGGSGFGKGLCLDFVLFAALRLDFESRLRVCFLPSVEDGGVCARECDSEAVA